MYLALSLPLLLAVRAAAADPFSAAAFVLADRLTECSFSPALGFFPAEQLWQSGATIETLSNVLLAAPPPRLGSALQAALAASFAKTPVIVDNCFDDHQWWGLGWARAFLSSSNASYLNRSAAVFDFIAQRGWEETRCGGGVTWCPPPTGPYKNAITTELFISLALALHPYAALLGKPPSFYSAWGAKAWAWLDASGMQNAQGLLNDGLDGATCANNGQTTWTYNQGVLLSGLLRLSSATSNPAPTAALQRIANATMSLLTLDGILTEPCPGGTCGSDGQIFKGMFVKHLAYALAEGRALLDPAFVATARSFFSANAASLLAQDSCRDGGFGFRWDGSECDVESVATDSAALDLLLACAAAGCAPPTPPPTYSLLGLGNCIDAAGASMPNCYKDSITLQACRDAAFVTPGAVGFDFHMECLGLGQGFCRVRTLAGEGACGGGFSYGSGAGVAVTEGDGSALTACYAKAA